MARPEDHLVPAAREALELPPDARIAYIRATRFAPYTAADRALAALAEQPRLPRGYSRPNLLVHAGPRQGKTTIARRYHDQAGQSFDPHTGRKTLSTLYVLMPPVCDARWFYGRILKALGAPEQTGGAITRRISERAIDLCRSTGVGQILIDEAHNLLNGNIRQQHDLLAVIRDFGNAVEIPLALFGTQDAREALSSDEQFRGRFRMVELPPWAPGEAFDTLIGTLVRALPLAQPSVFTRPGLRVLAAATGGVTAYIVETLADLAVAAVDAGVEQITAEALDAYLQVAEFRKPESA